MAQPANPLLLREISAGRAGLHLLVMLGAFAALTLIFSVVFMLTGGAEPDAEGHVDLNLLFLVTICGGGALAAGALGLVRLSGVRVRALGVASRSLAVDVLLGVPVAVASYVAYLVCFGVMFLIWPEGAHELQGNVDRVKAMSPDLGIGWLLLMMLAVASYEELLFRGFLVTHLRRITGSWVAAVVVGGALFASLHVGSGVGTQAPAVFFPLLAVAAIWASVFIWRRSLVPGIVGHALFNWAQLVVLKYVAAHGQT